MASATSSVFQIQVVEDILEAITEVIADPGMASMDAWAKGFVNSVHKWVSTDRALTTEQAKVVLRLFAKFRHVLIDSGYTTEEQATLLIARPRYRLPVTPSRNVPREVRYLGQNRLGFRFKFNDDIKGFIEKKINSAIICGEEAEFDWHSHLWIVPVNRATIEQVIELIGFFNFAFDGAVEDLLIATYASFDHRCNFRLVDGRIVVETGGNELLESWIVGPLRGLET